MTRRSWLATLVSIVTSLFGNRVSAGGDVTPGVTAGEQFHKQFQDQLTREVGEDKVVQPKFDMTKSPFPLVEVSGTDALAEFEKQKSLGKGIPVILGGPVDVAYVMENLQLHEDYDFEASLKRAYAFGSDFDIVAYRKDKHENYIADLRAKGDKDADEIEEVEVDPGEWPTSPEVIQPTVHIDIGTGKLLDKVIIALIPAKSSADIPAFLGWGDWNENPSSDIHVAVLRKWQRLYGAEIIGMTNDVLNLRVKRRPTTREEAMALATEQFRYCEDLVLQGTQSIEALAGALMVSDYWYFWWD